MSDIDTSRKNIDVKFMQYSTANASDVLKEEFGSLCETLQAGVGYHRKLWEWVFILHHARALGQVGSGKRALGFGVGSEVLPAVMAEWGSDVVATDAPPEIGEAAGWSAGNQLATGLHAISRGRLSEEDFVERVRFAFCDMNHISDDLHGFDLCWSSCALEHLGSLRHGMDFIINSVEKTLKVGGCAIHTTELNLSSDEHTLEDGWCVLYRRKDIEALIAELRARGHEVADLKLAPDATEMDRYVDVPPYCHAPHLKLELEGFVTTSVGMVIRRGR